MKPRRPQQKLVRVKGKTMTWLEYQQMLGRIQYMNMLIDYYNKQNSK